MTTNPADPSAAPPARRFNFGRIALIINSVLAVLEIVAAIWLWTSSEDRMWSHGTRGIYWLSSPNFAPYEVITLALVPAAVWLCIMAGRWVGSRPDIWSIVLLGVLAVVGYVAVFTYFGPSPFDPIRHVGSVQVGGHIYHLADQKFTDKWRTVRCVPEPPIDPDSCTELIFDHQSTLFECDQWGIMCQRVHQGRRLRQNYVEALTLDPDTGNLLLLDGNGEVVETLTLN